MCSTIQGPIEWKASKDNEVGGISRGLADGFILAKRKWMSWSLIIVKEDQLCEGDKSLCNLWDGEKLAPISLILCRKKVRKALQ